MTICNATNCIGSCGVSFHYDSHDLDTWFEVHLAVYTRNGIPGFYRTYTFKTLKAAHGKFEALMEKYGIR